MHKSLVFVNSINHQRTSSAHIVDTIIRQLLYTSCLNDDIETVRVIILQFLPLWSWILAIEFDVFVSRIQLFGDVHLDTFVSCNDDTRCTVLFEELCEDETSGTCAEEKDFNSNAGTELVKAMDSTSRWFEECGFLIGQVFDLV